MAYTCPRCSKPVQRGRSGVAGVAGGLVGALLYRAFGSFQCATCGKIPMNEFSAEVRNKARLGSIAMIAGALLLIVFVILLQAYLRD
jgi:DNA-directed RNA polymerase subunit RPC12/RpoP